MNLTRERLLVAVSLVAMLAAVAGWSYIYFDDQRSAATDSMRQANACDQLGQDIKVLRNKSVVPSSGPTAHMDINGQIARAVAKAGLPANAVARIDNEPPRHADTGNTVATTRFVIGHSTLAQLAVLLGSLDHPAEGLEVSRVHLATPADSSDSRLWSVETTLTNTTPIDQHGTAAPVNLVVPP